MRSAISQKKDLGSNGVSQWTGVYHTHAEIRMIIRMGSFAIVMQNMAAGGPNEMRAQPKNSLYVMLSATMRMAVRRCLCHWTLDSESLIVTGTALFLRIHAFAPRL